jgi:hypothetical protein
VLCGLVIAVDVDHVGPELDITRLPPRSISWQHSATAVVAVHSSPPNHALSNSLSTPGEITLPTRAGKARRLGLELATCKPVSWRSHSHRLPPRRPCTLSGSLASPIPTGFIFTLCGPDTELADTLGGLLATSRCLVGGCSFRRLGAQVCEIRVSVELRSDCPKDTFSLL